MKFRMFDLENHYVTFLIGKDNSEINLVMTGGMQDIWRPELIGMASTDFGAGDEIVGLNSTYDADFDSISLGFQTDHFFSWGIISLRYQHFDIDYEAKANWNLRQDFSHPVSFIHESEGNGFDIELGYTYVLSKHWDMFSKYHYRRWSIGSGYDHTFFSNGQSSIIRFNEAEWDSESYSFGIRYYL